MCFFEKLKFVINMFVFLFSIIRYIQQVGARVYLLRHILVLSNTECFPKTSEHVMYVILFLWCFVFNFREASFFMLMTSIHIVYILYMLFYAAHFVVAQMEAVHKPPKNTGFDLILKTSHLIFFSPHIYVNRLYLILIIFLVRYYLDCYFQHFTNKMKIFCILYTITRINRKVNIN